MTSPVRANEKSSFRRYARARFGKELLPLAPPGARVSPHSKTLKPANLGKIPCKVCDDGSWVGFAGWRKHVAGPDDLVVWDRCEKAGGGIGLQGRRFPALDLDINDHRLSDRLQDVALKALGDAPRRFVRAPEDGQFGSRCLLLYRGEEALTSWNINFTLGDVPHAIEWRAGGCQSVMEGQHPKGGQYAWADGRSPVEFTAGGLAVVTEQDAQNLKQAFEELLEGDGAVITSKGNSRPVTDGMAQPQEALQAPSLGTLQRALKAVENDVHYHDWFNTLVAVKAAGAAWPAEAYEAFDEWSSTSGAYDAETTQYKWDTLKPPYRRGWPQLAQWASANGDGSFSAAADEFDAVDDGDSAATEETRYAAMFTRYAWVEKIKRAVELSSSDQLDQEQFEFREPPFSKVSSWKILKDNAGGRRKDYKGPTFRPGMPVDVQEDDADMRGLCFNIWRDPRTTLPSAASEADVQPWLDHAAFIVPDPIVRAVVLDWMAWVIQHQDKKPNFAIVMGSHHEGIGKDTLIEPLRLAIGRRYVREVYPSAFTGDHNEFMVGCKLLIVQEMHNFERRATMNTLKLILAAPSDTVPVNPKGTPAHHVPNILAAVFFTNEDNALAIARGDRRYFVTWNDAAPREPAYYTELIGWLGSGGAGKVARWLLQRDVSAFNAQGRAPDTQAKQDMQAAARTPVEAWVEDGIADRSGCFAPELISLQDVWYSIPAEVCGHTGRPTIEKLRGYVQRAGARKVGDKLSLGKPPKGSTPPRGGTIVRLYSLARHETYVGCENELLRARYWKQRRDAQRGALEDEFQQGDAKGDVQGDGATA